jgi:hypothetical protein
MPELTEGEDYYWSAEGYVVLTEAHHRKRGYCCGMGCRHCPFDFEAVPEPSQSALLAQRQHEKTDPSQPGA